MKSRNKEYLFDIYKMFADTTQHISDCRQQSNNFYILLNTGIIAYNSHFPSFLIIILGILINIVWVFKIRAYKNLNKAKFEVIGKIERNFSVQVFSEEYKILKSMKHKNLSHYESRIPLIFILVFSTILLHTYIDKIINIFYCLFK